jgi:hypothetical protein
MMVWDNCCNVLGGATPVNIYYSADNYMVAPSATGDLPRWGVLRYPG